MEKVPGKKVPFFTLFYATAKEQLSIIGRARLPPSLARKRPPSKR
jgi:hypothetical protein